MAEGGGLNIAVLGSAAIGILVFAVVIMLGPTIGGSMEDAMPALGASSEWNSSYNTDIPTGAQVWEQTIPFLIVCAIVIIAAIIIYVIRGVA